ncbi:MAG TPA: helix-turn-helix transcriptional regulator [Vicinamibacterales bacterium]|nr:helix-turn-helix transcriptional regulator [Vicinamibacterales bacterium]
MTTPRAPMPAHCFQILLALADRDRHGLGIMHDVLDRTDGQVRLWPGMLYRTLQQLRRDGYIADAPGPDVPEAGSPRYYRLTAAGRRACAAEAARLAAIVDVARARRVLGKS